MIAKADDQPPEKTEPWHSSKVDDPELTPFQRLELITKFKADPRKLNKKQRIGCTLLLIVEEGITQTMAANILGVTQPVISYDMSIIRREYEQGLKKSSVMSVIGRLGMTAETAMNMARRKGDYKELWNIEKELFDRFQKVGMVPEMPKRVIVEEDEDGGTKAELVEFIIRELAENQIEGGEGEGYEGMDLLQDPSYGVDP